MRTTSTAIAAALAGILMAGTAIADSSVPHDPGAPRRDPGPASAPDLTPAQGPRPTAVVRSNQILLQDYTSLPTRAADDDAALDQMLGVLPGSAAEKEHATIIIDGQCWDLDTFFPERC